MEPKTLNKVVIIAVLLLFTGNAVSQTYYFNHQPSGTIEITQSQYVDNMDIVWDINVGTNNPIVLNYNVDIEGNDYDYIDIYAQNPSSGNFEVQQLLCGCVNGYTSTYFPTGRAKIVFHSDHSVSGSNGFDGFIIHFSIGNTENIVDNQLVNNNLYVYGKTSLNGNVGIGRATSEYKLDVAGNIRTSGEFVTQEMRVSKSNSEIGGTLNLVNPAKTAAGTASQWSIMNMSGNYGNSLQFWTYDNAGCPNGLCAPRLVLTDNGNVGIGTANPEYKLDVEGYMRVREIYVCPDNGCDYVFEDDYKLMNLNDLSNFIKTNKHLPEVAPAVQMTAEGIGLTEMNLLLLKKIEELTLYMIELKSEIETLKKQEAKP